MAGKLCLIAIDHPDAGSVQLAVSKISWAGVSYVRIEISEHKKKVSKNLVFLPPFGSLLEPSFFESSVLEEYKYYPPRIERITIHVVYE